MKKILFAMVAALMSTAMSFGQSTLVASLSHGDEVKMYYGTSALIEAVNESESGDVITLSGGSFACANFTKGITVRGTGITAENPTVINYKDNINNVGNTISISKSDSCFIMEGVIVRLGHPYPYKLKITGDTSNLYFLKSKIETGISFESSSSAQATFVDCYISDCSLNGSSTTKFSNCCIEVFTNSLENTSKAEFYNCLLTANKYNTNLCKSSFVNCILFCGPDSERMYGIPSETIAMNCLAIGSGFYGVISATDCVAVDNSELPSIFKVYISNTDRWGTTWYTPKEPYELTDEAKATYLGTDGKEMGLYGGQYPYDFTPLYPQITKMNVAKQTTVDNKLSVEIEVSAVE